MHTKSRYGIPEIVFQIMDHSTHQKLLQNSHEYKFEHVTSSPYHLQSNGEAECAVQTVKRLLEKEGDPYLEIITIILSDTMHCNVDIVLQNY